MKKIFLLAVGFALALTACQKDDMSMPDAGSASSFTVTIPQNEVQSRANEFGTGSSVNRCILEIYHEGKFYNRIEKGVSEKTVTFDNLRLVANQTYDFVFWADMADGNETTGFTDRHYTTSNLKTIKNRGTFVGSTDERDAFFYCMKGYKVDKTFSESVTLTRPFGLLVVKSKDLEEIKDQTLKPTGYKVVFKDMFDTFDATTGSVSGSTTIEYTADNLAKADDGTISMDFLWATQEAASLSDFEMTFLNNGTEICKNEDFKNIPIRRNYRTIVSGNLLTKKGMINVEINPEFVNDDILVDADQVKTIEDANKAFREGKTNVIVTETPTEDAELILPSTEAPVSVTLPSLTHKLTVKYADGSEVKKPTAFYLTTSSNNANVEIVTPNTTVTISGEKFAEVTASTSTNTLIISEGTIVEKLTVKAGNVAVYGTLKEIVGSLPQGTIVTLHVSTAAKLQEFAKTVEAGKNIYKKVVLDADIDFKGAAYTITKANNLEFDGQGHKLSNYKVENTQEAGLICDAASVTISNLTVEGANIKAIDDGGGNAYAGTIIGRSYGKIVLNNITVTDSKVEGVNKVGGMIGFVAENCLEATNCKVIGCTISNIDVTNESGQIGGFVGYLGNLYNSTCSFTNCSVEDTEINAYMNREDRTISKFIGCFQGDQETDIVLIDNCSVKQVTLNGMNDMARSFLPTYGDLLGGQRYGKGTVKMTNSPLTYSIANPAQLYKFVEMAHANKNWGKTNFSNATVKLEADIDLSGKNWVPANIHGASKFIFDGQGHTISNMSAVNSTIPGCSKGFGNGFFADLRSGAIIRNVTFDNAKLSRYPNDPYSGNCTGIVAGYAYATVAFVNVHVTNSVINGYGKVGGILGMAADQSGITSFENCSVTNTEIQGCYCNGGIIGLAQNLVTLQNCTTENVNWKAYPNEAAKNSYKELNTTLTDKNENLVTVKGSFWTYNEGGNIWYFPAFGDYYTDLYYDEAITATGERIAYGICHNK